MGASLRRYRSDVAEPFGEHVLHIDMDAFFVEVERRRDPSLRGVPVVVGGIGPRGVVASASYEARVRGVRSAMPTSHARRRVPAARFVPPDHTAYREASAEVFSIIRGFTPVVEPLSVDEAFLDISGLRLHYGSVEEVGSTLREAVRSGTGLPASVGIAASKLIAKLASEEAKPDGMLVVPAGGETAFLHPKPVGALWHVGEATKARLEELGIATIGDLAAFPRDTLRRRLGPTMGTALSELAAAHDPRPVVAGGGAKSVSVEQTYESDISDSAVVERELLRQSDRLSRRLRRAGLAGTTVTLKVRLADFSTLSRSETSAPSASSHDLFEAAKRLLSRAGVTGRPIRLLGLAMTGLEPLDAPRQLELEGRDWSDLDDAVALVRDRFGDGSVGPARLIDRPGDRES